MKDDALLRAQTDEVLRMNRELTDEQKAIVEFMRDGPRSTGQSGHFLSRHYDDMAQLWRRGEYVPMSLDVNLARAAAVGVTRLMPRTP